MTVLGFMVIGGFPDCPAMLTVETNFPCGAENGCTIVAYLDSTIVVESYGFHRSTQSHCFAFLVFKTVLVLFTYILYHKF